MCFFKRVLPFVLTLIIGVALSGMLGGKRSMRVPYHVFTDATTMPLVIRSLPDAGYTEEARRNRFEGTIRLDVLCDADGTVSAVEMEDVLPYGLTDEAVKAAQRIEFTPATHNGRRVSVLVPVEYSFRRWPDNIYETGFASLPEVRPERWLLQYQLNDPRIGRHY